MFILSSYWVFFDLFLSGRDSALSACSRSSTMSGMMDFEDVREVYK